MSGSTQRGPEVLDLLAGRWVLAVLTALRPNPLRFGDLRKAVDSEISDRSLTLTLRRLERAGLILHDGPDRGTRRYELLDVAESLLESLGDFFGWVEEHGDDLSAEALRTR